MKNSLITNYLGSQNGLGYNTDGKVKIYLGTLQQIRQPSQSTRPLGVLQWMHLCLGQAMLKMDTCLSPFQASDPFPYQWPADPLRKENFLEHQTQHLTRHGPNERVG